MIAAVLLPKKLDARAALVPLGGDALAAASALSPWKP